jgi:hypothetical protein
MTDKEVERNVRSTTEEGIRTPTQRHVHGLSENHAISFGERTQAVKNKGQLLEKFRKRERLRKASGSSEQNGVS